MNISLTTTLVSIFPVTLSTTLPFTPLFDQPNFASAIFSPFADPVDASIPAIIPSVWLFVLSYTRLDAPYPARVDTPSFPSITVPDLNVSSPALPAVPIGIIADDENANALSVR